MQAAGEERQLSYFGRGISVLELSKSSSDVWVGVSAHDGGGRSRSSAQRAGRLLYKNYPGRGAK